MPETFHRRTPRPGAMAVLAALALAIHAPPAMAADAGKGRTLSERWCSSCHVATTAQRQGGDAVPTFQRIARDVTLTPERVQEALAGRHPRMPDFSLTRTEIADLTAYILSLRGP